MTDTQLPMLSSSSVQALDELNGQTISGRFTIEGLLASAGGRDLFSGRQDALDRPVLIKMIQDAGNRDLCQRFLREGRLLAKLDHSGIVSVIDVGEHRGRPYMVMEAPHGTTLESLLDEQGRFDWTTAKAFLAALANAVGYAHEAGLVHRDLHPRNVVIGDDGLPRITDFVFAQEAAPYSEDGVTQLVTARGVVVGSVEWAAPEQLMGFGVDPRADLYALGVLAYRMVAGHVPHQATRTTEILSLHAAGHVPLMTEAGLPEIARPFATIVDSLLAQDADRRGFRNAAELARALRALPVPEEQATEPALPDAFGVLDQAKERAARWIAAMSGLTRRTKMSIGAALGAIALLVLIATLAASGHDAKAEVIVERVADAATLEIRADARQAVEAGDIPRALHGYRTLSQTDPALLERPDVIALARYLGRPNTNTGVAQAILEGADRAIVTTVLKEMFADDRSSRYLKRRCGEVLEKLGEPVDLVPLWISTLESSTECDAKRLAVERLAASDDPRASEAIAKAAKGKGCGAAAAKAAN